MRRFNTHVLVPLALAGISAVAVTGLLRLDALMAAAVLAGATVHFHPAGFGLAEAGATEVALPLTAACALVLWQLRLGHAAAALVAGVLATQGLVALAKGLFERPRPAANEAIADAGGYSFPSGHSATAAALFGALALVALIYGRGRSRIAAAVVLVGLAAAIGLGRVVLAAHYPSDVLGGWLLGGATAGACVVLARRLRRSAAPA